METLIRNNCQIGYKHEIKNRKQEQTFSRNESKFIFNVFSFYIWGILPFSIWMSTDRRRCSISHLLYFLATAESWSLMRPKPSIIVSSVSLLSSIVTVDSLGPLLMHGVSWSFICNRQVGTAIRLRESDAVFMSTRHSISTSFGSEIWFAKASFLHFTLFSKRILVIRFFRFEWNDSGKIDRICSGDVKLWYTMWCESVWNAVSSWTASLWETERALAVFSTTDWLLKAPAGKLSVQICRTASLDGAWIKVKDGRIHELNQAK